MRAAGSDRPKAAGRPTRFSVPIWWRTMPPHKTAFRPSTSKLGILDPAQLQGRRHVRFTNDDVRNRSRGGGCTRSAAQAMRRRNSNFLRNRSAWSSDLRPAARATLWRAGVDPATTGRPSYHPAVLLKLYLYGYLNRVQSSRRLETEAQLNVELMWLIGRLTPDFWPVVQLHSVPDVSLTHKATGAGFLSSARVSSRHWLWAFSASRRYSSAVQTPHVLRGWCFMRA